MVKPRLPTASKSRLPLFLGLLVLLLLAAGGWYLLTKVEGIERKTAGPPTLEFVPPPPPPPPPPPEPEEQPPEPVEEETVTPEPTPQDTPETPQAVTMDASGEAGGDAFGIQSGSGKGIGAPGSGTCVGPNCGVAPSSINDGFYRRYIRDLLQEAVRSNDKVNKKVFRAELKIWIESGRVVRAEVLKSSDRKVDSALIDALREARDIDAPPATMKFPQRVIITGRQSG